MGLLSFVDGKVRFDPGGAMLRQQDREAQKKAELEYQKQLAEQQQQQALAALPGQQMQAQQDFGKAAAALGLNAPDIGALALLARADPQQASGLLAQAAQARTPAARQGLANAQLQGQGYQQQLDQGAAEGPLRLQQLKQGNTLQQLQIEAAQRAGQQGQAAGPTLARAYELSTGVPVPKGYRPVATMTPDGQKSLDVIPIEGTPKYIEAQEAVQAAQQAMQDFGEMQDMLATYGTELGGVKSRKMRAKRDRLLTNYAKAQGFGVLQPGELVRLDGIFPDPTAWGEQINPMAAGAMLQTYQQLEQDMARKALAIRERFWFLPWFPITPAEQAAWNEQQNAAAD